MAPKVSVIVPNYNHAPFLEKRIRSILDQSFQDFELIYLDDASKDNSNEIVSKFLDDKRISTFFNQTNTGVPFKQWNKGVRLAKGEYIWLAESDDYADQHFLEKLVNILNTNKTVGLVYCQSWQVDENNNILSSYKDWTNDLDSDRWERDFINNGQDECRRYLIFKNTIPNASGVLLRRSVYEKAGYADESKILCGDWKTWIKILLISDIAFVATPLNYFRTHSSIVRHGAPIHSIYSYESYQVLGYILDNLNVPKKNVESAYEVMLERWCRSMTIDREDNYEKRNLKIYKIASKIDPKLKLRLLKKSAHHFLTQHHIISQESHLQAELEQLQATIRAMESSKFWKLHKSWIRLKQTLGLVEKIEILMI